MYCGISISNSLLFKRVQDAQYRSKLASDLMIYHMQVQLSYLVANDIIIAIVRAFRICVHMQVQLLHYFFSSYFPYHMQCATDIHYNWSAWMINSQTHFTTSMISSQTRCTTAFNVQLYSCTTSMINSHADQLQWSSFDMSTIPGTSGRARGCSRWP